MPRNKKFNSVGKKTLFDIQEDLQKYVKRVWRKSPEAKEDFANIESFYDKAISEIQSSGINKSNVYSKRKKHILKCITCKEKLGEYYAYISPSAICKKCHLTSKLTR